MSIYQELAKHGTRFFKKSTLFKHGLNWSPMYRRTTGRVLSVSDDLLRIEVGVPISYRNRNYVSAIFGGSLFSAVDPVPMVQLINLLDSQYVVWDKAAAIRFKVPAYEDVVAVPRRRRRLLKASAHPHCGSASVTRDCGVLECCVVFFSVTFAPHDGPPRGCSHSLCFSSAVNTRTCCESACVPDHPRRGMIFQYHNTCVPCTDPTMCDRSQCVLFSASIAGISRSRRAM